MLNQLAAQAQWGEHFPTEGAGVGWQDELRRLDEELAAGRLSAEEYRQLRDALLTSQGNEPPEPGLPESSPFPPPFKWDSDDVTSRMPPKDEVTTRMTPKFVPGTPNRGSVYTPTQTDSSHVGDAERTQIVPGPAAPPLNQPVGYPAPWPPAGDQVRQAPPWAGQDLPPIGQEPTWLRQGPEAFDTERQSSTRIVAIVMVVLMLLGGGAALYWLVFRPADNQPPATASSNPPTPTTTTVPPPAGPFIQLNGQIVINETYSMDDAIRENRPARSEIKTLTEAGTETIAGFVTETGGIRTGIWTFKPEPGVKATDLLEAIDQLYHRAKYQDLPGAPAGVRALYLPPAPDGSTHAAYRAHYLHEGLVVRVESYGGDDLKPVEQKFNELLSRQLKDFPVSTP